LIGRQDVEAVALAYAYGMDGWRLATSDDPAEMLFLRAALERAITLGEERDERLAKRIISTLSQAMK
jgi:hypothetical protein